jgi:lysophospholipase L1-like esterase
MTRHSFRSRSLFQNLTPFVQPAAFSALLAVAGAGLACGSGSDVNTPASGGQKPAAGGSATTSGGSSSGGAGSATGGTTASGGTLGGMAGSATAGSAPTAGSGGIGGSGVAGGVGVGGSGAGGAGAGSGAGGGSSSGGAGAGGGGATHWVGTWTASPYPADTNTPAAPLANSVIRQVTHASLGGSNIRVQFSNINGDGPVTIKSAHVALCKPTGALVDGSIDTTTDKALAFSGMAGVTIAKGAEIWSDPIDFTVPALGNVTITTAFGSVPTVITSHAGARTDSYVVANSTDVSAANLTSAPHNLHWFFISGIDVMAPAAAKGIVAIGDSITDGRDTTDNGNTRWTDYLAARLQANPATANVSIMNQGIGGTPLVGTTGTAAEARFARDVLGQSGVKYAIILDGVNDIAGSNPDGSTLTAMKAVYDKLIKAGHDKSILVYGGTITPFGGNLDMGSTKGYYTAAHETLRQQLNTYIKSGVFDGVIDFDAAVTDGGTPPKLSAATMTGDGLHPKAAGYKLMAEKADLTLFTK